MIPTSKCDHTSLLSRVASILDIGSEYLWRFLERVPAVSSQECWPWQGSCWTSGYGYLHMNSKPMQAHRIAYRLWVGDIPEGLFVLHRCDNPPCINPRHLFVETKRENNWDKVRKGRHSNGNTQKTSCKRGHLFTVENTRMEHNKRHCRTCSREYEKRRYRRRKK